MQIRSLNDETSSETKQKRLRQKDNIIYRTDYWRFVFDQIRDKNKQTRSNVGRSVLVDFLPAEKMNFQIRFLNFNY